MTYHVIIPAAGRGLRMGDGQTLPKSLRPVGGRAILLHTLDALAARSVTRITLVVGHGREHLQRAVGNAHRGVPVDYVLNAEYATTEHGWSLALAAGVWREQRLPALFMDADNVFDTALLDRLLSATDADVVLVDPELDTRERDEELVLGRDGRVTGFARGRRERFDDCVGGFVGMNRFSSEFMGALFDFTDAFFPVHGRSFKYERVFDRMLHETGVSPAYLDTAGLRWVNVNHAGELAVAERIVTRMAPT